MLTTEILSLNEAGEDTLAGKISWDGSTLTLDPPDSEILARILAKRVSTPNGEMVTAQSDPGRWVDNLYRNLNSPYLRATRPSAT